jgi:predicted unusual protein kinase regulating ubiquinone biosynthesis (AarF/ABC1/UbiB family)
LFQAFALNNQMLDEELNNQLLQFTDNAPWSKNDINVDLLNNLMVDENIVLEDGIYSPINSGMISLVYKGFNKNDPAQKIIIKLKRKNIQKQLFAGIKQLQFLMNFISFFPNNIFEQYKINDLIQRNIDIIKHQVNFHEEVQNMIQIKKNCKNLNYIKIPDVYPEITNTFSDVIMMEYIEGAKINEIYEHDYEGFARQVLKFGFVTSMVHGFTHGDLHAGNILFIKDTNDIQYPYKLGILDFGIMYPINEHFKNIVFDITCDLFNQPVEKIAKKILDNGLIIQPLNIIQSLEEKQKKYILDILTFALNETIHNSKDAKQIRLYDFIHQLHSHIQNSSLHSMGLYLSDDFVKTQLVIAMAHGITMKLCKENYIELADKVINELFHTDLIYE